MDTKTFTQTFVPLLDKVAGVDGFAEEVEWPSFTMVNFNVTGHFRSLNIQRLDGIFDNDFFVAVEFYVEDVLTSSNGFILDWNVKNYDGLISVSWRFVSARMIFTSAISRTEQKQSDEFRLRVAKRQRHVDIKPATLL